MIILNLFLTQYNIYYHDYDHLNHYNIIFYFIPKIRIPQYTVSEDFSSFISESETYLTFIKLVPSVTTIQPPLYLSNKLTGIV